jgi:hypothetical protein
MTRHRGAEDDRYRWLKSAATYNQSGFIYDKSGGRAFPYIGSDLIFEQQFALDSDVILPGITIFYKVFDFYDTISSEIGPKALLITDAFILMGTAFTGHEGLAAVGGTTTADLSIVLTDGVAHGYVWSYSGALIYAISSSGAGLQRVFNSTMTPALIGNNTDDTGIKYTGVLVGIHNGGSNQIGDQVASETFRVVVKAIEV